MKHLIRTRFFAIAVVSMLGMISSANATTISYVSDVYNDLYATQQSTMNGIASDLGMTSVYSSAAGFSSFNLAGTDILVVEHNSGQNDSIASRRADVESWVRAGGSLFVSDWNTSGGIIGDYNYMFGQTGTTFSCCHNDVTLSNPVSAIAVGVGGTLTDSSLDGAGTTSHRGVNAASLLIPVEEFIFNTTEGPNSLAAFGYQLDQGYVMYTTMPLFHRFYGNNNLSSHVAFRDVFAPNAFSFLENPTNVPEPYNLAILGLGLIALRIAKRKVTN